MRTYPPVAPEIEHLREGLIRYSEEGVGTGSFLGAVLENNLAEALMRADETSLANLKEIVSYVYWNLPAICWGSPAKVTAWMDAKRAERENRE